MHGRALGGHRAQLQGELVLDHISADVVAAFEGWAVVSATTISYAPISPLFPVS